MATLEGKPFVNAVAKTLYDVDIAHHLAKGVCIFSKFDDPSMGFRDPSAGIDSFTLRDGFADQQMSVFLRNWQRKTRIGAARQQTHLAVSGNKGGKFRIVEFTNVLPISWTIGGAHREGHLSIKVIKFSFAKYRVRFR